MCIMKTKQQNEQPEEPTVEYVVIEDESNILDIVFDKLFEQIEKEIQKWIKQISIDNYLQLTNNGD